MNAKNKIVLISIKSRFEGKKYILLSFWIYLIYISVLISILCVESEKLCNALRNGLFDTSFTVFFSEDSREDKHFIIKNRNQWNVDINFSLNDVFNSNISVSEESENFIRFNKFYEMAFSLKWAENHYAICFYAVIVFHKLIMEFLKN